LLEREKWRVVSIEPESPRDLPILDSILCVPAWDVDADIKPAGGVRTPNALRHCRRALLC
jgi:hypothetical protein